MALKRRTRRATCCRATSSDEITNLRAKKEIRAGLPSVCFFFLISRMDILHFLFWCGGKGGAGRVFFVFVFLIIEVYAFTLTENLRVRGVFQTLPVDVSMNGKNVPRRRLRR